MTDNKHAATGKGAAKNAHTVNNTSLRNTVSTAGGKRDSDARPPEKSEKENPNLRPSFIKRIIYAIKFHIFRPWQERDEFRFNTDANHPQYVYRYKNKKYSSLGFTHEPETFGQKNMPLKRNPKKGDSSKAYIRNGVVEGSYEAYGGRRTRKNLEFEKTDKANVKSKIRHYKNEERKKKNKK